jgi:transposase
MPSSSFQPGRQPDPATRHAWQQRLDRFRRSGLTVAAFCDREGVSAASFYAWRRRLGLAADPAPEPGPRFVPVRLVSPPVGAPVELLLPSGPVLRLTPGVDLAWLRQLLDVLGGAAC